MAFKRYFILSVILLFFFAGCSGVNDPAPTARQGVIDLRSWNFHRNGTVKLEGDWEFHWKKFLEPRDFEKGHVPGAQYFHQPLEWSRLPLEKESRNGVGYATMHLTVLHDSNEPLSLDIPIIYTAYRLYINGRLAASAGEPGISATESVPRSLPQIVDFVPERERTDLVFHVSNFHHWKGGFSSYRHLMLGAVKTFGYPYEGKTFIYILLIGASLAAGFFHLLLYLLRREEPGYFYFGITCLFSSLWIVLGRGEMVYYALPDLPWHFFKRAEYISSFITFLSYMLFVYNLHRGNFAGKIINALTILYLLLIGAVLFLPSLQFTYFYRAFYPLAAFSSFYSIYIFTKAQYKDDFIFSMGYLITVVAMIFLLAGYIFPQSLSVSTRYSVLISSSSFIIINSFYLARRHILAMEIVTKFSTELEEKVSERTAQLEQSSSIISRINDEQKELLHLLCHDLTAPFLSMKSLLSLVKNSPERFRDNSELFMKEVTGSVETSMGLIEKVRRLSEAGEQEINAKPVNLHESVRLAEILIKNMLIEKNITLQYEIPPRIHVMAEPEFLVHSVLLNIISNAAKFSPAGSVIDIQTEEEGGLVVIKIVDHGIGIPKSLLEELFTNPSACRRQGTDGEKGSGFGLALAKKFLWYFSGSLEIISRSIEEHGEDHGTTVIITLPTE